MVSQLASGQFLQIVIKEELNMKAGNVFHGQTIKQNYRRSYEPDEIERWRNFGSYHEEVIICRGRLHRLDLDQSVVFILLK